MPIARGNARQLNAAKEYLAVAWRRDPIFMGSAPTQLHSLSAIESFFEGVCRLIVIRRNCEHFFAGYPWVRVGTSRGNTKGTGTARYGSWCVGFPIVEICFNSCLLGKVAGACSLGQPAHSHGQRHERRVVSTKYRRGVRAT